MEPEPIAILGNRGDLGTQDQPQLSSVDALLFTPSWPHDFGGSSKVATAL